MREGGRDREKEERERERGGAPPRRGPLPPPPHFPSPSSFIWLTSLLTIAALLRPFAPLTGWRVLLAPPIAVAAESATLAALYAADRSLLRALTAAAAAAPTPTLPPTVADATAMAATHGLAHGLTHAALLFLSWLPLAAGGRTLAPPHCPSTSLFAGGAVASLAATALHTGCAVVMFAGLDARAPRVWGRAIAAHAAFAGASLLSFVACGLSLPARVVVGAGAAVEGGMVAWRLATVDGGRVWARPVGGGGEDE